MYIFVGQFNKNSLNAQINKHINYFERFFGVVYFKHDV